MISPSISPWIFNEEVFFSVFSSISNCEYWMVNFCSTSTRSNDSTFSKFKIERIRFYIYWNRRDVDSSFELSFVWFNFIEFRNITNTLWTVVFAWSFNTCVRIVSFELKWIFLNVLKGVFHTSIGSSISEGCRAINELLYRKCLKSSSSNSISCFNSSSGGERPAIRKHFLAFFNRSDCSIYSPVFRLRVISLKLMVFFNRLNTNIVSWPVLT